MSLSNEQRSLLAVAAQERGLDSAKLIAAAEAQSSATPEGKTPAGAKPAKAEAPAKNERPLYMYHLPFVTVNEVREQWLGLAPIAGGDENAAKYAAAQASPTTSKPDDGAT